jgi:hypothetical protein
VLSTAGLAARYPITVLVRESRSERRSGIMRRYLEKLGAQLLFDPRPIQEMRAGRVIPEPADVGQLGDAQQIDILHENPLELRVQPAPPSRRGCAPPGWMAGVQGNQDAADAFLKAPSGSCPLVLRFIRFFGLFLMCLLFRLLQPTPSADCAAVDRIRAKALRRPKPGGTPVRMIWSTLSIE